MADSSKVLVLLSGGMDSVTALYDAYTCRSVSAAVSFHYGSKHNDRELACAAFHAQKLSVPHRIIRLDFIDQLFGSALLRSGADIPKGHYQDENMKQTVVPFRNGILMSIATGFAESEGADAVLIAAHAGDHAIYPDCRREFMDAMTEAVRLGTYAQIKIARPFIGMTKGQIAVLGRRLGVDYRMTWSCYVGGDTHCGECGTCVERREAFQEARIDDPTPYLVAGPLPPKPASL